MGPEVVWYDSTMYKTHLGRFFVVKHFQLAIFHNVNTNNELFVRILQLQIVRLSKSQSSLKVLSGKKHSHLPISCSNTHSSSLLIKRK